MTKDGSAWEKKAAVRRRKSISHLFSTIFAWHGSEVIENKAITTKKENRIISYWFSESYGTFSPIFTFFALFLSQKGLISRRL
jgi:hypothetical protein